MRKTINQTHVEGYIYEHTLEKKVTGPNSKNPGTEFISGYLNIATDDEMTNIVRVHFTYVTAVTAKGGANATYNVLNSIIEGKIGNAMEHGKENAGKIRVDSAVGLNEWYTNDNTLVSVKINEGGFVHQTAEFVNQGATFDTDMLITKVRRVEADPDKNLPEKVVLTGYVFDFRQALLPVEYSVYAPIAPDAALDYFENLGATEKTPVFTHVKGAQISQTVVRTIEEESAFGKPSVKEVRSSQRDFVVNWASPETYEWDAEESILASELATKIQEREVYLADMKKRRDEYEASRGNAIAPTATTAPTAGTPSKGGFDF